MIIVPHKKNTDTMLDTLLAEDDNEMIRAYKSSNLGLTTIDSGGEAGS